jgi:hypothetical protein
LWNFRYVFLTLRSRISDDLANAAMIGAACLYTQLGDKTELSEVSCRHKLEVR